MIQDGSLHIFLAFDIGFEIKISQISALFPKQSRDPVGYNFLNRSIGRDTLPIRLIFDPVQLNFSGITRTFQCYATFFDIGALSLEFICEIQESVGTLPGFVLEVQNSKELKAVAQKIAEDIFKISKPAVMAADFFATPLLFTVFNIRELSPRIPTEALLRESLGVTIAQTLRSSLEPIGQAEIDRTLNPSIAYSDDDTVFVSSNVAVIFDQNSNEVIDVFELLNVQSLELRFIDAKLDKTLQSLYEATEQREHGWRKLIDLFETQSRKLNSIHLDSTIIVERVQQSYKFATDSYLVRIYELCVHRMFLTLFSTGIDKKLQVIRDIINDRRDRATSVRMEVIEWIVVILIAVDMLPKLFSILK